jgi:hypothetical protein
MNAWFVKMFARHPWVALVLVVLCFVGSGLWGVRRAAQLMSRVDSWWLFLAAGAVLVICGLILARTSPLLGALVLLVGPVLAYPPRGGGDNPWPLDLQLVGAGALVASSIFVLAVLVLKPPQVLAARSVHGAEVHWLRPGDDPDASQPSYYVALCRCSWSGEPRATEAEAEADAREHAEQPDAPSYAYEISSISDPSGSRK